VRIHKHRKTAFIYVSRFYRENSFHLYNFYIISEHFFQTEKHPKIMLYINKEMLWVSFPNYYNVKKLDPNLSWKQFVIIIIHVHHS
jgi:hypothetical protein